MGKLSKLFLPLVDLGEQRPFKNWTIGICVARRGMAQHTVDQNGSNHPEKLWKNWKHWKTIFLVQEFCTCWSFFLDQFGARTNNESLNYKQELPLCKYTHRTWKIVAISVHHIATSFWPLLVSMLNFLVFCSNNMNNHPLAPRSPQLPEYVPLSGRGRRCHLHRLLYHLPKELSL